VSVRFGTSLELHGVGFTTNISSRGLGVSALVVHPAGTRLRFELKLPGDEFCRLEGVVAWSMRGISALQVPGSMGIRLDSADEAFFRFLASQPVDVEEAGGPKSTPTQPAAAPSGAPTVPASAPGRTGATSVPASAAVTKSPVAPPPSVAPPPPSRPPAPSPAAAAVVAGGAVAVAPASSREPSPVEWWQEPDVPGREPARPRHPMTPRVPRFFEQIPIRFGVTSHLDLRGFTENISRTGMAITCSYPLTPGDTVLFALTLPDERRCHGTGSVMWTRLGRSESVDRPVMGIRIARVEHNYKELLDILARKH
jgi:hypothetical protein